MPPRIRGVCFDLDDTLIVYEPAVRSALTATAQHPALQRAGVAPSALQRAVLDAYATHFAWGSPGFARLADLAPDTLQEELTTHALATLGLPQSLAPELRALYRSAERDQIRLMPGAQSTLAQLYGRVALGIITNGPARLQREKIARFALEPFLDATLIDTECGYSKPDHRIFDGAAEALHLAPNELLFVGNSLEADIHGAAAAGWDTAWLTQTPPTASSAQERRIQNLNELLEQSRLRALL